MQAEKLEPRSATDVRGLAKRVFGILFVLFWTAMLTNDLIGMKRRHFSPWDSFWLLLFAICAFWVVFPPGIERFLLFIFGNFERTQICSPDFEERIRKRYQAEASQLGEIEFDCVFFYGESYPLYRLLLIFPAIVFFSMWRNRVPMTLQGGARILIGNPVFVARDKSAYAHTNDMGITFHTAFENGSVFVSRNFGDDEDKKVPAVSVKVFKDSGAEDLWTKHQLRIQEKKLAGNQIDCQSSFEAYRQMILKEEAAEGTEL